MGAWSHTSFGNDGASDFVYEVEEDGEAAVANAFEVVNNLKPSEYLDSTEACVALAAAELVAAAGGRPPLDFPEQAAAVVPCVKNHRKLQGDAMNAVQRVLANSELRNLWIDTQDFDAWRADVEGLLERLK